MTANISQAKFNIRWVILFLPHLSQRPTRRKPTENSVSSEMQDTQSHFTGSALSNPANPDNSSSDMLS